MEDVLAILMVLTPGVVVIALWLVASGNRAKTTVDREINANHHGLYLLVNDMVSVQERGWTTVFPDQQTLDKARALLAGHEEQITGLGPRLPAGERAERGQGD